MLYGEMKKICCRTIKNEYTRRFDRATLLIDVFKAKVFSLS